ncbi:MAG: 6-carboxytetrahydropterin synthase [Planctomycetes bacterium]|nr:6-carboxytetrahydropterin synthase [Planctomycetota bacterium]MBI3836160.1 6-carboxytetrahydropterin synthase [Planctomycetota bacterium]
MYTVSIESHFSAIHSLRLADGSVEPPHGHDWRVRAIFESETLDSAGMVVDFEIAQQNLAKVLSTLGYCNLNTHLAFANRNATAEAVARYIFDALRKAGMGSLESVEVTEAPGCLASYRASN